MTDLTKALSQKQFDDLMTFVRESLGGAKIDKVAAAALVLLEHANLHEAFDALSKVLQKDPEICRLTWGVPPGGKKSTAAVSETVDHPAHYGGADDPYEAIKVIEAWRLGFCLGNTVKYVRRADHKGKHLEDLKKARWYLDREIARREAYAIAVAAAPRVAESMPSCTCNRNECGHKTSDGRLCEHSDYCPQAMPWQKERRRWRR